MKRRLDLVGLVGWLDGDEGARIEEDYIVVSAGLVREI